MSRLDKRVLFNASNLHVGGGVQVATSTLCEWAQFEELPANLEIWVSSEVDRNVRGAGCDVSSFPIYRVVDSYGLEFLISPLATEIRGFNRVFTLFGPLYIWKAPLHNIVGFAQPWIIYPDNSIIRKMPWHARILTRVKYVIQECFFRNSATQVVELEHVARSLVKRGIARAENIRIIHNCLGSIYSAPASWAPVYGISGEGRMRIGFMGRNYPHKNTGILPKVRELLRINHSIGADFYVTFSVEEWESCPADFKDAIQNVGSLSVAQCPSFYQQMDAIIFPSLLECFSATPLEALAMEKPLFASDRPFNRDVCGSHANYFDPDDPADVARTIAEYFSRGVEDYSQLSAGRAHALGFSNARDRAIKYLALLAPTENEHQGEDCV